MSETQQSITQWIEETFGVASDARILARANEEMAELLKGVASGESPAKLAEECADVLIVLCPLAQRLATALCYPRRIKEDDVRPYAQYANLGLALAIYRTASGATTSSIDHAEMDAHLRDCVGHLSDLAFSLGSSLQAEVEKKMARNRSRTWKRDGTGCGYHVKEGQQ